MAVSCIILALAAMAGASDGDLVAQRLPTSSFLTAGAIDRASTEAALLARFSEGLKGRVQGDRVLQLEAALRPMVQALPQEAGGGVGHGAARYALHRFFAREHRWFVKGLTRGGAPNEWVPSHLQDMLERRLRGSRGLSVHELAVLAATLEDLVRKESVERLEATYKILGVPTSEDIAWSDAEELIDVYMMVYLRGGNVSTVTSEETRKLMFDFTKTFPDWSTTESWLRKVEGSVATPGDSVGVDATTEVVDAITQRFGAFNDATACKGLKAALMDLEDVEQPGRVRLSAFYKKALAKDSPWAFTEKKEFLRALGALDESEPERPRVILPNYVGSRPQCLEASGLYAVCCPSECEDLLGQLEFAIGTPLAEPSAVARLVAAMRSSTVEAPRELSPSLLRRLEEAAAPHGGKVQLHGRLFAQWMHHAFPRECPFPHEASSITPQSPDEWMREMGQESTSASEEDMQCIAREEDDIDSAKQKARELPWRDAEELFDTPSGLSLDDCSYFVRAAVLVVVVVSLAVASREVLPGIGNASGLVKPRASWGGKFGRRWWLSTLALLVAPLVIITMDFVVNEEDGNELFVSALCFGLAALVFASLVRFSGMTPAIVGDLRRWFSASAGIRLEKCYV